MLYWLSNFIGEFYLIRVVFCNCIEKNFGIFYKNNINIMCVCIFCFVFKGMLYFWEKFLFFIYSLNFCIFLIYGIVVCV